MSKFWSICIFILVTELCERFAYYGLTGSLVIERIFAIPGTGSHFVNSALNRDYTLSMGVTILYTVLVYGLNTLVDLAYTFLDPRIKLEES